MRYMATMTKRGHDTWCFAVTAETLEEAQERAQRTADLMTEGWTCTVAECAHGGAQDDCKEWA